MNLHGLRWLGHVLRMPEHRLPRSAMLTGVGDGWKRVRGSQTKTWHQSVKSLTSSLSHVVRCSLLGWGPHDYRNQWLETLGDMTQNRSEWRRCIHSLSSLKL
ncbi:cGMP-specific 3',5'-cyclic phosphodiesterase [Schistosoma haematobium]|uniref:cGMP-specific 3',5'-cyclic phosphodiesterase n=1 Tax=Schistosoma haematobium TaxID=6185 RepID=A0A922IQB5_SCHHA|nr:cGMP-specific 3',5'-cyclic phosphodiesterase [Schistosoma haematobium]KAH9583926.1 cGMP-specific 3',5'-cyclic phosphodiesterase [Schistosoma haematobium]